MNQAGKAVKTKLLDNEFVIVYYSAGWCPPCQKFTPSLVKFYNENKERGSFEIVFFSFDNNEKEMYKYMTQKSMSFPAIKFAKRDGSKMKQFAGRGIPFLVMFDKNGKKLVSGVAWNAMPKIEKIIHEYIKRASVIKLEKVNL